MKNIDQGATEDPEFVSISHTEHELNEILPKISNYKPKGKSRLGQERTR